jgi:uncharacterized protein YkwD
MPVRTLAAIAAIQCILFALCSTASASTACPGDLDVPDATTTDAAAAELLCDANVLRAQNGVGPVRVDTRLTSAAQGMAADMAARRFFAHVTPDGLTLADRVAPTGYLPANDVWLLTENLAWGLGDMSSPLSIAFGWMNSPEHRLNLLDPEVQDVGIAVTPGPDDMGGMIYVADFGSRGEPPTPAPALTLQSLRLHFLRNARNSHRTARPARAQKRSTVRLRGRGFRSHRG